MAGKENETSVTVSEYSRTTEDYREDNDIWFVQESGCLDEVTLKFDDDSELYVSAGFLIYASPVFKAMLTSDFIERKNKMVKLTGKSYDDLLMFLKCIHPGILLKITATNVAIIAPLAEEYQVGTLITSCKEIMTIWLRRGHDFEEQDLLVKIPDRHTHGSETQLVPQPQMSPLFTGQARLNGGFTLGTFTPVSQEFNPDNQRFPKDVNVCLKILHIASQLNYVGIEAEAVSVLSKIPYKFISGEFIEPNTDAAVVTENRDLYKELPHKVKLEICQGRLRVCDK